MQAYELAARLREEERMLIHEPNNMKFTASRKATAEILTASMANNETSGDSK